MKIKPNYLAIVKDCLVAFVVLGLLMLVCMQVARPDNSYRISAYKTQMQTLEALKQEYSTSHILDPNREYLRAEIQKLEDSTFELELKFAQEGVSYE